VVTGGVSYLDGRVLNLEGVGSRDAGSYCCLLGDLSSCVTVEVYEPGIARELTMDEVHVYH